jgi:hypothetical protein
VWCSFKTCLKSFLRRLMTFPTSQKLYNENFCTDVQVSVETEAHRVHARRSKRVNECMCVEHNCDLSACVHNARLWATKPVHK